MHIQAQKSPLNPHTQNNDDEEEEVDCPFDIDGGDNLVIDEGDDRDELFSPVIVSTCSLKREREARNAASEEAAAAQSEESSRAATDMLELRNLRRKYHNPVRSLCVKFDEILRQVAEFAGSAFIQGGLGLVHGGPDNGLVGSTIHHTVKEYTTPVETFRILYKRRPIRNDRQIAEKNKRQGLAFSKKLRDSAQSRIWAR